MNYGQALEQIKGGKRMAREGWNGKGLWVCLVTNWNGNFGGDLHADWSAVPFIAIKNVDGGMVPWAASQTDALADDWLEASAAPLRVVEG